MALGTMILLAYSGLALFLALMFYAACVTAKASDQRAAKMQYRTQAVLAYDAVKTQTLRSRPRRPIVDYPIQLRGG
jgi:hypothetical protein